MKLKNQNNLKLYNQRRLIKDKNILMRVIWQLCKFYVAAPLNIKNSFTIIYRKIVPFVFIFITS